MAEPVRLARGLWRAPEAVDDFASRVAALLSIAPPDSVIGGWTAAQLHRLWLPEPVPTAVELLLRRDALAPREHAHTTRPEFASRRCGLAPDDIEVLHGLPVTTAARTWVDLGARLSLADLVAVGDSALRGATSVHALERSIGRARRRRGIVRVKQALPLLDPRSRSRPESHLRVALVTAGLPPPGVNVAIYSADGEWLAEPDLSYDDVRLALEYNGSDHADVGRMRRDITRELDMSVRGGWRTLTVGPAEVFRRPDQIASYVGQLRRSLLRRGPQAERVAQR